MSILKVSIREIKAARALLDWSQSDLAAASGVSEPTIKRLESAKGSHETSAELGGRSDTAEKIVAALSKAGITFIRSGDVAEGPGVALRA
jgi:predicted transcriptional regulator